MDVLELAVSVFVRLVYYRDHLLRGIEERLLLLLTAFRLSPSCTKGLCLR